MKKLSAPEDPKPIRITKALLDEWAAAEERRLLLSGEARDIAKRQREIEEALKPAILAKAGDTRRIESCGFELAIITEKGSVGWKSEFIRVAGLKEANRLIAAAPEKEKVEIRQL